MIATIQPSAAHGRMTAPPSKSMAHRLLICAALAEGTSVIRNIELSQDILATIDCLKALGADISCEDGKALVRGTKIRETDHAIPSCRGADQTVLSCRESGSTLRFMFPLCLLNGLPYVLTGSGRLFERPLKVYEMICKEQGLFWKKEGNRLETAGILAAGEYEIPGNVSSQFISGLLFALPLLEKDSRIRLIRPVVSRPYIDMTVQALRIFGVQTAWRTEVSSAGCVRRGRLFQCGIF